MSNTDKGFSRMSYPVLIAVPPELGCVGRAFKAVLPCLWEYPIALSHGLDAGSVDAALKDLEKDLDYSDKGKSIIMTVIPRLTGNNQRFVLELLHKLRFNPSHGRECHPWLGGLLVLSMRTEDQEALNNFDVFATDPPNPAMAMSRLNDYFQVHAGPPCLTEIISSLEKLVPMGERQVRSLAAIANAPIQHIEQLDGQLRRTSDIELWKKQIATIRSVNWNQLLSHDIPQRIANSLKDISIPSDAKSHEDALSKVKIVLDECRKHGFLT